MGGKNCAGSLPSANDVDSGAQFGSHLRNHKLGADSSAKQSSPTSRRTRTRSISRLRLRSNARSVTTSWRRFASLLHKRPWAAERSIWARRRWTSRIQSKCFACARRSMLSCRRSISCCARLPSRSRAGRIWSAWATRTCSRPSRRPSVIASRSTRKTCCSIARTCSSCATISLPREFVGRSGRRLVFRLARGRHADAAPARRRSTRCLRIARARGQLANLSAQTRLPAALALAGLGASLSKFALDVRVLSSPAIGEMFEPFGERQVGSSAMPFKRNPILSERIGSLARLLPAYADVAFSNAATNMLERTLDDSANRRTILPEALLCTDEIVGLALRVARGLRIDEATHHAELANVRSVCGNRNRDDDGRQGGRKSSRAARIDSRTHR